MFCITTIAEKLVDHWTAYACQVGCSTDTNRSFNEVKNSIGYSQFIQKGLNEGLDMNQISDCWDLVQLNLISIRG